MVRASSINPTFTHYSRLCIANALTALSGAMVGQYQNTADINGGTGIVVIGLACLIIGETVLGRRGVARGVIATVIGSIIYRFIYAIVLYTKIMPVQGLKTGHRCDRSAGNRISDDPEMGGIPDT